MKRYLWRLVFLTATLPALLDWRSLFLAERDSVLADVKRPVPVTTVEWKETRARIEQQWEKIGKLLSQEYGAWPRRSADEHELRRVERVQRRPLPVQYREMLLAHDGMHNAGAPIAILPIQEAENQTSEGLVIAASNVHHDLSEPLDAGDWWTTSMWMMSDYDSGEGYIVDMASGEVWLWSHDGGLYGRKFDDCLGWMKQFEEQLIDYAR